MKITINPTSSEQLGQWRAKLDQARADYMTQTRNGITSIILDDQVAHQVLGLEQKRKVKLRWYHYILIFVGFFFAMVIILPNIDPPPVPPKDRHEMTREELQAHYEERFGTSSEWLSSYMSHVRNNYPTYPRTFRFEGYRIIPIDADSMTYVFIWSARSKNCIATYFRPA